VKDKKPEGRISKKPFWITMPILVVAVIAFILCLPNRVSPNLPAKSFAIAGYTNNQGFRVLIQVTNSQLDPCECAVASQPRIPPGVAEIHYSPYAPEEEMNASKLPRTVNWVEVLRRAEPVLYREADGVARPGEATISEIGAHQAALFSVRLWPTNETFVVVKYRTPARAVQKARLAVAKSLNIAQSRLLHRRPINFRSWDDRPYRIVTAVFQPVLAYQQAP